LRIVSKPSWSNFFPSDAARQAVAAGGDDAGRAERQPAGSALPLEADRTDMRSQWIARFLANPLVDPDKVMAPFARQVLERLAGGGEP
jgi:hypothetical protein